MADLTNTGTCKTCHGSGTIATFGASQPVEFWPCPACGGAGTRALFSRHTLNWSRRSIIPQPLMRLPSSVVPDMTSNKAGWFKVKDLVVNDREIMGKVAMNFLASSRFRIDRRTGVMTSSGGYRPALTRRGLLCAQKR